MLTNPPIELPPIPVCSLSFFVLKLVSTKGFNVSVTKRMYFLPCPLPKTVSPTLYSLILSFSACSMAITIIFPILYSDITASFLSISQLPYLEYSLNKFCASCRYKTG